MRLELQPFEVDVLSVVTGAVKSNGYSYYDDYALPKESLYKPIEDIIASRAQGNDGMTRMDTTEYADAVVDAVLKRTTGKFWYGSYADSVRMSTTATTVLQDAMVYTMIFDLFIVLMKTRMLELSSVAVWKNCLGEMNRS